MLRIGVLIMLLPMLLLPANLVMPTTQAAIHNPWLQDRQTRIVRVREAALVTIPWDDLAESGWDLSSIALERIQVVRQGTQRPIQISALGISFLADANNSQYSSEAAYWIGIGGEPGLRTFTPNQPTAPFQWAPDLVYQSIASTTRGDRWFAGELRSGAAPLTAQITLRHDLPIGSRIALDVTPIELRANHQISVAANRTALGNVNWDDTNSGPRSVILTTITVLAAGDVTLTITLGSDSADVVLLDGFSIPAERLPLPDLTPALEWPRSIPSSLSIPSIPSMEAADQLVISHPDLIAALDPLIAAKQAHRRSIAVADVLAIYDAYSWGERDPQAIRAFIQAIAAGSQHLESVLLVGAGTAHMRVGPSEADQTLIPPFLLDNDPTYAEISCDTCYTRFDSADVRDDPLPNLPIGRIPARNLAEAHAMLAKTIAALSSPSGAWRAKALLVADNDRDADGTADPAGPFLPLLNEIATGLPGMQVQTFAYAPDQTGDNGMYRHAPILRANLLAAWDSGAGLIGYVGHASPWQWAWTGASEPVLHVLNRGDAVRTNGMRLPILLSMTCLSGSFANPRLTSIDEELLRQPGGGIVAALTPGGSGVNTGHRRIVAGLLPELSAGHTLGQAHLAGLATLLAQPGDHELAFSYGILGDPDVVLPQETNTTVFLPSVIH
ncbi:MAG: C25 family cysteine peptidase [Roseiflexaceae bacterium]|nr:C25 family cysteine peptidase [Roseiflexaceae bacterium]